MMKRFVLFFMLAVYSANLASASVGCMDENGSPVDWWVILKVPYLSGVDGGSGYNYAYADANNQQITYTGKRLDQNTNGALASTLQQIFSNSGSDSVGYIMYNDQSPDNSDHDSYGHTKGDLAFDSESGFWLVHSVPRWPQPSSGSYDYPDKEHLYGQSFLCMTYSNSYIDSVGAQLLLNKPYIYDSNLPSSLSDLHNIAAAINHNWVGGSSNQSMPLTSAGGQNFLSFAKTAGWGQDLYEDFVQPYYGTGMLIETWMNGANSNKMPTFCSPQYSYNSINIREIQLTSGISWPETKDHSKWTVSTDSQGYICIGDINRQYSQSKRGGGTVCAYLPQIWKSFSELVSQSDSC